MLRNRIPVRRNIFARCRGAASWSSFYLDGCACWRTKTFKMPGPRTLTYRPRTLVVTELAVISLLLVCLCTSVSAIDGNASCATLQSTLQLENTTILSVSYVPANSTVMTAGTCQSSATVTTSICRVYAQVATTNSSTTKFEMWLPDEWFGRFVTVGNGGLNGCKPYLVNCNEMS